MSFAVFAIASPAHAAELQATPSNFSSQFTAARSGDTLVLAAGSYGTFRGAAKSGQVTITAAAGATVNMNLQFTSAANLTFDGLRFGEIEMAGTTHGITVRNSTIAGQTTFRTGELANANILFDHNAHPAWNKCNGCGEGRVFLPQRTSAPSGITIQNSRFGPGGDSDGIQNGSNGTRILNNEFVGIKQIDGGNAHADSIQLYGSKNTVIRGNYFHDVSNCVMGPDGTDHEVFEDNVCVQAVGNGTLGAIQFGSDQGSTIVHNTFFDSGADDCDWNKRCGILAFGAKTGNPTPSGTVVRDNIVNELSQFGSGQSESYNLLTVVRRSGLGDLFGMPAYVGGGRPTSYDGFALALGAKGKGAASDGLDMGARIGSGVGADAPPVPDPTPFPTPEPTPAPTPPATTPPVIVPPAPVTPTGLVAAYGFEEKGRVVRDGSGRGNDGRLHGGRRTTTGKNGHALFLGGASDYLAIPLRLRSAMTVAAWVKPAAARSWKVRVGRKARAAVAARLSAHVWTYVVTRYDGKTLRIYRNGRLASAKRVSGDLPTGRGALQIGGGSGLGQYLLGTLDDVRVYDHALSGRDVMADMGAGA